MGSYKGPVFSKEFEMKVVQWHFGNGSNINQTSKK